MKVKQEKVCGNALVVTLVTIAVLAGFVALSIDFTRSVGRNVQRSTLMRQATNIGDAATEMAFADWRAICITNSASPAPAGKYFDTNVELPSPSPGNFPGVSQYVLKTFSVVPVDSTWTPIANKNTAPPKTMGPNPQNFSYYYLATADVIIPTLTAKVTWTTDNSNAGNVVAHVKRIFEKYRHNKTDKAIDYKDDLEIHPGPTFVVNGDVHTNGDLWTAHSSLTLNGTTTYAGTWGIDFMPGDSQHTSDTPASPAWGNGRPPAPDQAEVPFGVDTPSYHSLIENVGSTDPLYNYSYSNKANYSVKITIDASNNVKIFNGSGTDITAKNDNSADGQVSKLFRGAVKTGDTIIDNREGATTGSATIGVTTLDVGAINTALINGSLNKVNLSNPVVYVTDTSADPNGITSKRAVRLKNGAILPDGGLTIASSNPVYIQGDYNTGTNGTNVPESNTTPDPTNALTANPARPTTTDYDRQPAAVIADAVSILSNNWIDTNPPLSVASNTTINTAIIAGIVPTGNGYYSGGAENFPRFLENWANKTLTYYGSMIELYTSKQAIGRWGANNVYSPPNRAWYFDKNFLSNPPPGVPYDVDYRRSRWFMD